VGRKKISWKGEDAEASKTHMCANISTLALDVRVPDWGWGWGGLTVVVAACKSAAGSVVGRRELSVDGISPEQGVGSGSGR